jgi:hypothetical protein
MEIEMTNRMWVAAALAVFLRGGSPDVTGEWHVVATLDAASAGKGSARRTELVCAFEQHDAALSGACRPVNGPEGVLVSGTVRDRKVEWSFRISPSATADKETALFHGTLAGRTAAMKGTFTLGEQRGTFDAKRDRP